MDSNVSFHFPWATAWHVPCTIVFLGSLLEVFLLSSKVLVFSVLADTVLLLSRISFFPPVSYSFQPEFFCTRLWMMPWEHGYLELGCGFRQSRFKSLALLLRSFLNLGKWRNFFTLSSWRWWCYLPYWLFKRTDEISHWKQWALRGPISSWWLTLLWVPAEFITIPPGLPVCPASSTFQVVYFSFWQFSIVASRYPHPWEGSTCSEKFS